MSRTSSSQGNSEGQESRAGERDRKRCRGRAKAARVNLGARLFMRQGSEEPLAPRASGAGEHREPPAGLAPGGARRSGRRGVHVAPALAPHSLRKQDAHERGTLCAALASGSREGWVERSPEPPPGAALAAAAPAPRSAVSSPLRSHSPAGCAVSAAAAAAATPARVMIPGG